MNGFLNTEFMSSSFLRSKGIAFTGVAGGRKNPRLHILHAPPGGVGASLEPYSVYPGELEMLFAPGFFLENVAAAYVQPADDKAVIKLRDALKAGGAGSNFGNRGETSEPKTLEDLGYRAPLKGAAWVKVHTARVVAPRWWHGFLHSQLEAEEPILDRMVAALREWSKTNRFRTLDTGSWDKGPPGKHTEDKSARDNKIDIVELTKALGDLNPMFKEHPDDIQALFVEMDTDSSGTLDINVHCPQPRLHSPPPHASRTLALSSHHATSDPLSPLAQEMEPALQKHAQKTSNVI